MLAMLNNIRQTQGFTLIELIVSVTVLGVLTTLVLTSLGGYYYSNVNSAGVSVQDTDTRAALRQIESDVASSAQFLDTTTVSDAVLGPGAGSTTWSYTSDPSANSNGSLIVTTYATDADRSNLIFTDVGSGCDPADATPLKITYVYFVAKPTGSSVFNLYRRTIVPNTATCSGTVPAQSTSCAAGNTGNSLCKGVDALIVSNVKDAGAFNVKYYQKSTDTGAQNVTGTNIQGARTIEITLKTNKKISGQDKQSQATIRMSRLSS